MPQIGAIRAPRCEFTAGLRHLSERDATTPANFIDVKTVLRNRQGIPKFARTPLTDFGA